MLDWATDEQLLMLMKQLDQEQQTTQPEEKASEPQPKAWLQVKDGVISFIAEPGDHNGVWPEIEAVPPLKLVINGNIVAGPQRITADDTVGWHMDQKSFRLDVSPDKMKVRLLLLPDGRCSLRPTDHDKTHKLVLKAAEDVRHPITLPTLQTVIEAVQEMGIVLYDLGAIMSEVQSPAFVPVIIARGKEPVQGKDGELELFFNENIEDFYEEINGVIDYRNHLKIPSVRQNALIARKLPMRESIPGHDVYGHKVKAPRPKDFVLLGRQHVKVVGDEAFAMKDGRPRVTGNSIKLIDITTSHIVPGDVDMKTGNVVFTGDVHIYGNVADGMIVEALGDVYIAGNVYCATITATGSIYVKGNTVGSKLYSGHFGVLFNRLFSHSTKLNERLTLYRQVAGQLRQLAEAKGHAVSERQLHQLLLESKFGDIPDLCKAIQGCIANIQSIQRDVMKDLKNKLDTMGTPLFLQQGQITLFIMNLQHQLIETIENIRRSGESDVCTDIQQCHLSEIMSNGNIMVRKQGVVQSRLYSKDNIIFYESDSVCRGSELEAGHTISAMIVGGVAGGATKLKAGQKVVVSLMYEGKVTIGKFSKEILDPIEHVSFKIKDNRLCVDSYNLEAGEIRSAAN